MQTRIGKQFLFEVKLDWMTEKKGVLSAKDAEGELHIATPLKPGIERVWTPEHFFLSSISGCFMTTYIAFAKKYDFEVSNFECNSIGLVDMVDDKYKFTHIDLYPKVYINSEELREKAELAMEKTHQHCLITNSVNADVFYHSEIQVVSDELFVTSSR